MNNEKMLNRLKKIYSLSIDGIGGEKDSARSILEAAMNKYGVSEVDLIEESKNDYYFEFHGREQQKILVQVIYMVLNKAGECYMVRNRMSGRLSKTKIRASCTPTQKADIEVLFDFYAHLWTKEKDFFLEAFIQKHRLFGALPDGEKPDDMSDDQYLRMLKLMSGMEDQTPVKRIEGGTP